MKTIVKPLPDASNNPEAFDNYQPRTLELSAGLAEGAELVSRIPNPLLGGGDLVASFEATDQAQVRLDVTADGREWTEADSFRLIASVPEVRRYTFAKSVLLVRYSVKATRACQRVAIYSQVRS
jgi:hypothetical protein